MAKRDADRHPLALWARKHRLARGWTTADVAKRLGLTEPSYRGYEAGRPSRPTIQALEKLYGDIAPDPSAQPVQQTDMAELVEAIRAQTATMDRLVIALEKAVLGPDANAQALATALSKTFGPLLELVVDLRKGMRP